MGTGVLDAVSSMTTILNHLSAFWAVVVVNCAQPVNWKHCGPVHEWLFPEIATGVRIFMDSEHKHLYIEEREALKQ